MSAPTLRAPDTLRPLLVLAAVLLALVVLPVPAGAAEKRVFGDVTVREPAEELSVAFGDVRVEAPVDGDVHAGVGDITVGAPVGGDVEAAKGEVRIEAPVAGDVSAGLGDVYVGAPVDGDVEVEHGDVYLLPGGSVGGDLSCGNGELHGDMSRVAGNVRVGMASDVGGAEELRLLGFAGWLLATLVFTGLSVLAAVLFPGSVAAAARRVEESPGRSLLFGALSVPVAAILFAVLLISIVGSPISIFVLAPLYLILLLAGTVAVAFAVGRRVALATGRYRSGNAFAAVVGAVLVSLVYLVPFLGGLLLLLITLLGTGAVILALVPRGGRSYP